MSRKGDHHLRATWHVVVPLLPKEFVALVGGCGCRWLRRLVMQGLLCAVAMPRVGCREERERK